MKKHCSTCEYYIENTSGGFCHRYPHKEEKCPSEYCGEWESKEPLPALPLPRKGFPMMAVYTGNDINDFINDFVVKELIYGGF